MTHEEQARETAPDERKYEPPRITSLGSIRKLTRTTGPSPIR